MAARGWLLPRPMAVALVGAACTSTNPPGGPSPINGLTLQSTTPHFRLHYGSATASRIADYGSTLEASWARITGHFNQPNLGLIEGWLHPDAAAFTAATGYSATGSVDGPGRFHMVSIPYAPEVAVHEFTHNVTLHLNPSAGNNPVWLWETVAVYEAGQFVPPSHVPYLAARQFPTLAELSEGTGPYSVYDVGYLLGQFIIERWDWTGMRALINAQGDTVQTFGLSIADFERDWREFVINRYLS